MSTATSRRTRATARKAKTRNSSLSIWLILGSVLIVALGVATVLWSQRPATTTTPTQSSLPASWIDGMSLGNPEALVTIQAWEDFLCSHCRDWTATIEPQLMNDYIKPGNVRLEFHPFPLQGFEPSSSLAAMAASCAADQNLFWPYHDRLFAAQDEGQAGYSQTSLLEKARAVGLDEAQFTQCLASNQHQADVAASVQAGLALGINSTPSIFVNGQAFVYPFDYAGLKAEIDRLLQAQGS